MHICGQEIFAVTAMLGSVGFMCRWCWAWARTRKL